METINFVIDNNLKEYVSNNLDDMFEAKEKTLSEQLCTYLNRPKKRTFLMDKAQSS
jgi:hypothetical protein